MALRIAMHAAVGGPGHAVLGDEAGEAAHDGQADRRPTGTSQSGTLPSLKPLSSSHFSSAGSAGSVARRRTAPKKASTKPRRLLAKIRRDAGEALAQRRRGESSWRGDYRRWLGACPAAAACGSYNRDDACPQPTLSVILITKNESANIDACLASVAFADEWIVVDSREQRRHRRARAPPRRPGDRHRRLARLRRRRSSAPSTLASGRWVLRHRRRRARHARARGEHRAARSPRDAGPACLRAVAPVAVLRPLDPPRRLVSRPGRCACSGAAAARFSADRVHERVVADGPVGRLAGDLLHLTMPTHRRRAGQDEPLQQRGRRASRSPPASAAAWPRRSRHAAWAFVRSLSCCAAAFSTAPPASPSPPTSPRAPSGAT